MKRIAFARINQETNALSPVSTTLHEALATPAAASSELADGLVALILDGVRVRPRS